MKSSILLANYRLAFHGSVDSSTNDLLTHGVGVTLPTLHEVDRARGDDGEVVDPKYRGGMGDVYQGTWRGSLVAIKRWKEAAQDRAAIQQGNRMMKKEAFMLLSLTHPLIVECLGISYSVPGLQEEFCVVFPWYKNGTLADALANSQNRLSQWVLELSRAIEYLHTLPVPILHGDLKASNVLIDDSHHIRLTDFGLARSWETTHTMSATDGIGTVAWKAPEMFKIASDKKFFKSMATDVWALGCTIFEMYQGEHPWAHIVTANHYLHSLEIEDALRRGRKPGQRPMSPIARTTMPEGVWRVVEMCWHSHAKRRPPMSQVRGLLSEELRSWIMCTIAMEVNLNV